MCHSMCMLYTFIYIHKPVHTGIFLNPRRMRMGAVPVQKMVNFFMLGQTLLKWRRPSASLLVAWRARSILVLHHQSGECIFCILKSGLHILHILHFFLHILHITDNIQQYHQNLHIACIFCIFFCIFFFAYLHIEFNCILCICDI